ncbi:MAG: SlyX family protein [Proteobacteria bacterium]|nr:SlyX family protein [Pseudomonadota bacterium]
MQTEERFIDIEIKLTRQEDLVDALNQTIYRQQQKIDELETLCTALARHVGALRDAASAGSGNEKPPHY